jgi:cytochrome b6-f complex iron-sulfur subunit
MRLLKKFMRYGGMMKRRRFLKIFLAFLGSITFLSFTYSFLKFLTSLPSKSADLNRLTLHRSDIPSGTAKNIVFRNTPAVIINRPDKGYFAFSRICTHLGCLVEYNKSTLQFICPCHAGTYDLEGNVVSGPPPKPLAAIPVKIEGETIIIG